MLSSKVRTGIKAQAKSAPKVRARASSLAFARTRHARDRDTTGTAVQ